MHPNELFKLVLLFVLKYPGEVKLQEQLKSLVQQLELGKRFENLLEAVNGIRIDASELS